MFNSVIQAKNRWIRSHGKTYSQCCYHILTIFLMRLVGAQVESLERMSWNASVTVAAAVCVGTLVAHSEEICMALMVHRSLFGLLSELTGF